MSRESELILVDQLTWKRGNNQRIIWLYKRVYLYETVRVSLNPFVDPKYDVVVDLQFPVDSMENLVFWYTEDGVGLPIFKGDSALDEALEFVDNWREKGNAYETPTT